MGPQREDLFREQGSQLGVLLSPNPWSAQALQTMSINHVHYPKSPHSLEEAWEQAVPHQLTCVEVRSSHFSSCSLDR